ncbi:MAG: hypothetical protein ACKVTZ_06205 [Bacteroidia bacterium]
MKTVAIFSHLSALAVAFTFGMFLTACDPTGITQVEESISELKSKDFTKFIGKEVTVKGYLVANAEGGAELVSDLSILERNNLWDESNYIRMENESVRGLFGQDLEKYVGTQVEAKAIVQETADGAISKATDLFGASYVVELKLRELPKIIKERPIGWTIPIAHNICDLHPAICQIVAQGFTNHYALLFSGGANSANAHIRYWNDLKYMYQTLKKQGYTDERIVVVYKNGIGEDSGMPVDYAASISGLENAFAYLNDKTDGNDQLFFFATNHGGGFHTAEVANKGGLADDNADEIDTRSIDETVYYYNENVSIRDDYFTAKIAELNVGKFIAVLEPCFSGGFLRDLRGKDRVIISAASEFEYSWARAGLMYDEFSYHFTAALNGVTPEGGSVNADTNGDGWVNMLEAYKYAKTHDAAPESPKYEDNGDGNGTDNPVLGVTSDGDLGATLGL